jgi:pantothenate kinase
MKTLIAIGGLPATGKSTIMKKFMEGLTWVRQEPRKLVVTMYNKEHDLHIVGDYSDPNEKFPGLDRLSMAVQPEAIKWLQETESNVLFEGDRLFTGSFLEEALKLTDAGQLDLKIIFITADPKLVEARHVDRADTQSEKFIQGRETKLDNIRASILFMEYISEFKNNTPADTVEIVNWLRLNLLSDDVIELIGE